MSFYDNQRRLKPGWSRITREGTEIGGLSNNFYQNQVGYNPIQNQPYPNQNQSYPNQNQPFFRYNRRRPQRLTNSKFNRYQPDVPRDRLNTNSNFLGNQNLKGGFIPVAAPPTETETQNLINSIKNESPKKLCIEVVGVLRKVKQDNETIQKVDQFFAKPEEAILKSISELQTRAEVEPRVLKMITINRLLFSDLRHATADAAKSRLPAITIKAKELIFEIKRLTEDETVIKLIKAQARALNVELATLLEWLEISSLDELKNTAEIDELDRKQARMLACSKPLTEAETIEMENFISGELTNHGRAHGILATASTSSLPREIAIQTSQPIPQHEQPQDEQGINANVLPEEEATNTTTNNDNDADNDVENDVFVLQPETSNLVNSPNVVNVNRLAACTQLSSIATSFQTQPSPMHTRSGIPIRSHSANSDTPRKKVQAAEFINTVWDRNSKKCKKCNQPMDKKMMIDHFRQVHNDVIQSLGVTFL